MNALKIHTDILLIRTLFSIIYIHIKSGFLNCTIMLKFTFFFKVEQLLIFNSLYKDLRRICDNCKNTKEVPFHDATQR